MLQIIEASGHVPVNGLSRFEAFFFRCNRLKKHCPAKKPKFRSAYFHVIYNLVG